jgi:Cu(I)/Ag(I) efflux system membrane fusion protein
MPGRHLALSLIALAAGLAGGIALERLYIAAPAADADGGPEILYWVAPMDPNYRRDGPGKSPMGMDLVPVYEGEEPSGDPAEVQLSGAEINAIGVRTALARVEPLSQRIETVGFVGWDEHLTSHVHLRVEGWIDELRVRAVGDRVERGDLLFTVYAPEIVVASSELQRGTRRGTRIEIEAARRKLQNFGVTPGQIERIARADDPVQRLQVFAPRSGIVTDLEAADGMYLTPETQAMTVADLSAVWLLVDVFERDIGRLSPNMTALARFEHLPGRVFEGTVDYVYPELDPKTRTLPVRLRFDNAEGLLRPNMFGRVTLLGGTLREAVTVPAEAVIRTGRADRVILQTGEGTFAPRLVTLGLRDGFGAEGRVEIVQGLAPGETVVASAQFLLDSESALNAGLMRMAPTEDAPAFGTGRLVALDPERRQATVRHGPLDSLDWPAMETVFALGAEVPLDRLAPGEEVEFAAVRGPDGLLALAALKPNDGIDATGTGVVHAVTPDGKLTLSHDPIPALSWPAMRMDLPVANLDPAAVPLETPVEFDLAEGDDGLFAIVAVRAGDSPIGESAPDGEAFVMAVDGTVNAVDAAARTANVTHGPLAEIGMPGMTMDVPLASGLDPSALSVGDAALEIAIDETGALVLQAAAPKPPANPPMRASGTINAVDSAAGTANVTHGPLAEIGMPGMTMDFRLGAEVDPAALPKGVEVELLLRKEPDFSLTLLGVEGMSGGEPGR